MMRPVCQTPHCPCSLRLLPQLVETTDSWGRRGEGRGGEGRLNLYLAFWKIKSKLRNLQTGAQRSLCPIHRYYFRGKISKIC